MIKRIYICALLALSVFVAGAQTNKSKVSAWQKLGMTERVIAEMYVDSVDETKITEEAIRAMLKQLDPHSQYTNPEETRELNEPLEGNFSGIGVQFNMHNDTLYVIQTIAGGPSERVGILPGDRIIAVNDTVIAGVKMKNSQIMKRLRGVKGSKVNVSVLRKSVPEPLSFTITRDDIPLYSIDASYMIDSKTGYVRLSRFAGTSYKEFMEAVKNLKKEGMKQLIVDLTDNGGGYLNIAIDIANEFLDKDQLIVYTEGRASKRHDEIANGKGSLKDIPVVLLVNQYSASASEILSGALQDWDRAVVVGRRTFGKGLVQRPLPFPDESMIRLTVARYYTPAGRSIQKPYSSGDVEEYSMDIINRYNKGELMHSDSIHFPDSLKVNTLKNSRVIYGGGGIMPDHFVPLDTIQFTKYYRSLVASGCLYQYSIDYVDANRNMLKSQYADVDDFISKFEVDEDMLQSLINKAESDSIKLVSEEFAISKSLISAQLKALIGRDVFGEEAYFKVMNARNDIVKAALDIINDTKQYKKYLQTR